MLSVVMQQTGTRWSGRHKALAYPRFSRESGVLIGRKFRPITAGRKPWNEPDGISHSETYPFMWSDLDQGSSQELWITEGESDLLAIVCQQPLPRHVDVMAVPGASAFPPEWVSLVEEYGRVVLFADNDAAGARMVQRVCALVPTVRSAELPSSVNDVTDFLRDVGSVEDLVLLAEAAVAVPVEKKLRRYGWEWKGKEASEFDDLLSSVVARDVRLRRKGKELVGLCPFHEEHTPSFHVNVERGVWRCHGCDKAGDVVSYVKVRHGLNYQQANLWLKEFR